MDRPVEPRDVRLRPLRLPEDVEVARPWYCGVEVLRWSEGGEPPYSASRVREMFETLAAQGEVYIIEVRTDAGWQAVGDVTLTRDSLPITIGVPAFRGRGVGRTVIRQLEQRARDLGWNRLRTRGIDPANRRSIRMFEAAGFVRRRAPVREADGGEAIHLEKVLTAAAPPQGPLEENQA